MDKRAGATELNALLSFHGKACIRRVSGGLRDSNKTPGLIAKHFPACYSFIRDSGFTRLQMSGISFVFLTPKKEEEQQLPTAELRTAMFWGFLERKNNVMGVEPPKPQSPGSVQASSSSSDLKRRLSVAPRELLLPGLLFGETKTLSELNYSGVPPLKKRLSGLFPAATHQFTEC